MKIGETNIRHSLLSREEQVEQLLIEEDPSVLFLTEVDQYIDNSFEIVGYKSVVHKKSSSNIKTRIIALVRSDIYDSIDIDVYNIRFTTYLPTYFFKIGW